MEEDNQDPEPRSNNVPGGQTAGSSSDSTDVQSFHGDSSIVSEDCTPEPSTDRDRTGVEAKQRREGCWGPRKREDGEDEVQAEQHIPASSFTLQQQHMNRPESEDCGQHPDYSVSMHHTWLIFQTQDRVTGSSVRQHTDSL
ncbi:uncharacterized protein LOC119912636 isoform X2 [Micropterus salmoides]|uniref:uncharacterized protein LOC119912636 isoform X2 n=1 Tax=Micropterus salmoides TaxID=27706 RepID=UPI0018ED0ED9|nr:uncharacterized protein LOC119912636 isoform X2 [Micropterus salmoides]